MCSYTGSEVTKTGCLEECQGCEWILGRISTSKVGTSCQFTWSVTRQNCERYPNQTFTGQTTVPCNEQTKITFYCDPASRCPGYELTLVGDPCPAGGGI